jgi:glycosyltransferase involved in cell wall biosynthesis
MSLNILLLSHSFFPSIGGIEVNSELFAEAFTEAGHSVRLLTWSNDPVKKDYPYSVIRNPGMIKLLQQYDWADVVFENNPCLRLAWPNLFFRRPSIIVLNTWIARSDGSSGYQDIIKRIWLKRAQKVISVSNAIRVRCWPDSIVILNPYRFKKFRIIPSIKRNTDFVFLGRLVSDKGADQAIYAIHRLLTRGIIGDESNSQNIHLTIIGDGPERENLLCLASNLKVEKYIRFAGRLEGDALAKCLNHHKFLLVPSLWEEPFGNVVLEGMACGCLPIVSDGGGLPEAVGDAGIIFKRGNIDELVKSMISVLGDSGKESLYRSAAENHLTKHHPGVVSKQYLEVIESVI